MGKLLPFPKAPKKKSLPSHVGAQEPNRATLARNIQEVLDDEAGPGGTLPKGLQCEVAVGIGGRSVTTWITKVPRSYPIVSADMTLAQVRNNREALEEQVYERVEAFLDYDEAYDVAAALVRSAYQDQIYDTEETIIEVFRDPNLRPEDLLRYFYFLRGLKAQEVVEDLTPFWDALAQNPAVGILFLEDPSLYQILKPYLKHRIGAKPRPRTKVGGRKKVTDDPLATPAQIEKLAKKDPLAALAHVNCPPDLWWRLAEYNPLAALHSPLFGLFALENPARWKDLEATHVADWLAQELRRIPDAMGQPLAADGLAHIARIVEEIPSQQKMFLEGLAVRRSYADGTAGLLEFAQVLGNIKSRMGRVPSHQHPTGTLARWYAVAAASEMSPSDSLSKAAYAEAVWAPGDPREYAERYRDAQLWQWHRLLAYYKAAPDLPPPLLSVGAKRPKKTNVGALEGRDVTDPILAQMVPLAVSLRDAWSDLYSWEQQNYTSIRRANLDWNTPFAEASLRVLTRDFNDLFQEKDIRANLQAFFQLASTLFAGYPKRPAFAKLQYFFQQLSQFLTGPLLFDWRDLTRLSERQLRTNWDLLATQLDALLRSEYKLDDLRTLFSYKRGRAFSTAIANTLVNLGLFGWSEEYQRL